MGQTNGSESERMMAQIEAFLRTGEGPPAAPEPEPPSPLPPTRLYDIGDDGLTAVEGDRPVRWAPIRRVRLPRFGWWPRRSRPVRRSPVYGDSRRSPVYRDSRSRDAGRRPGGQRLPSGPPRWTPLRVFLVSAMLLALLVLPVIWSNHATSTLTDGGDRASAAPAGPGYAFLQVDRTNRPFRWDPCQAIYYQTDLAGAPAWAASDLQAAVERISAVTGIDFVDEGPTTRSPISPVTGTPTRPAPVLVAWATAAQSNALGIANGGTGTEAMALTEPVVALDETSGRGVFVTGTVTVDPGASRLAEGFGPGGLGVLLLQQMARLMGLDYVESVGEVMNPAALTTAVTALGPGDRAGLARLGTASGCLAASPGASLEPVL